MKINIAVPQEHYEKLNSDSLMLGRIACEVERYATKPTTTTYECVVAMKERLRQLNKKVRLHKAAGGELR